MNKWTISKRKRVGMALILACAVSGVSLWYFGIWEITYEGRDRLKVAGLNWFTVYVLFMALVMMLGLYLLVSRSKDSR
jgi:hypothetical protein